MRDRRDRTHLDLRQELRTHLTTIADAAPARPRGWERDAAHAGAAERHAMHQLLHDIARGEDPDRIER